jgi:chemotaxis protein MotB
VSKHTGKVVIVKKKKGHGHGHHGGAWKVAYADFVTAMMAFFMVMWIVGMDQNTKDLIEGYFSNPVGFKKGYGAGKSPLSVGTSPAHMQQSPMRLVSREVEEGSFRQAQERIRWRVSESEELDSLSSLVEVMVGDDGLRIELVEGSDGATFFGTASASLTPAAERTLAIIADELRLLQNPVVIEGHTDAAPFPAGARSNWELSAERANAARRALESRNIAPRRIVEVRGLADRRLRVPDDPLDPANRRISILLPFAGSAALTPTPAPVSRRAPPRWRPGDRPFPDWRPAAPITGSATE